MKTNKYICDICGNEITNNLGAFDGYYVPIDDKVLHVCIPCKSKIRYANKIGSD